MNFEIRQERPEDFAQTEDLTREAFWNQYAPGCSEHFLLHIMRDCPAFVKDLDLVAVLDHRIVGNVVFVKGHILTDNRTKVEVLTLGPISVHPNYQRKGIGRKLIERAAAEALKLGFKAIVLCGDPDFYSKVGFVAAEKHRIRTSENKYFAALQIRELFPKALKGIQGRYFEDPIYNFDQKEAEKFDKLFEAKTKLTNTPGQLRLAQLLSMQKDFSDK